jgi:hypothetical protein
VVTATFKNKYFKSQLNNRIKFTTSTVEIKWYQDI